MYLTPIAKSIHVFLLVYNPAPHILQYFLHFSHNLTILWYNVRIDLIRHLRAE